MTKQKLHKCLVMEPCEEQGVVNIQSTACQFNGAANRSTVDKQQLSKVTRFTGIYILLVIRK